MEEEKKWLGYDITSLKIAMLSAENMIENLKDVEDFDDDRYEHLKEIYAYMDQLKMEKEIELEREAEL